MSETNGAVVEAEEVTEAVVEEVAAQDAPSSREELLQKHFDSRVEDSVADDSGEEEETETDEVATKSEEVPTPAEGPTAAMREVALASLPKELVDTARDDEQLTAWLNMARQQQPEPTPEVTEAPAKFELSLPEDEFPADDPVRKALDDIVEHFGKKVELLGGDMGSMAEIAQSLRHDQEAAQQETQRQEQAEFDQALDGIGGALGKAGELNNTHIHLRTAAFNATQDLRKQNPKASIAELTLQAAAEMGFKQPETPTVIKKSARQKLGGKPTPPAATPPKSREELLGEYMMTRGK